MMGHRQPSSQGFLAPGPAESQAGEANGQQRGHLFPGGHGGPQQLTGRYAQQHGGGEGHAAQQPGVGGAIAKTAEHCFVDRHRQVHSLVPRTGRGAVDGNQDHQQPVAQQQHDGQQNPREDAKVHQRDRRDQIAAGDGLQRVAVDVELREIGCQQVALGGHPQHEQDQRAEEHLAIEGPLARAGFDAAGEREGHGRPHNEEKQRHDEVPSRKALPAHVVHLHLEPRGSRRDEQVHERDDDLLAANDPKHVEAAERIDRGDTLAGGGNGGSGGHGKGLLL